jgi:hypothetical protein
VKRKFRSRSKPTRRYKRPAKMCLALLRLNQRMSQITRTIELKSGVQLFADGLELGHNRIATTRRYKRPAFCVNTECVVGAQIWCTVGFGCM